MDEKERKRQERKERILKQGANRLNKIVNSYSGDGNGDGSVEGIVSEAVSEPASVIEKEDSLEEPVPVENPTETLEEPEKITETTPLIERINPSFVDNDLQLPSLNDPFQDPQPQQPTQKSDLLGWIHAILFTCFTAYFFMVWVRQHSHDLFAMDQVDQNVWYKKSCRQLVHMASHPVHNDLGASSVFHVWGYVMPAWSMFFTFEVVTKEHQKFQIPEMVKPAMISFGFNPTFYENIISSLWGYYEMYNTFMADMYIVIVLMGLSVSIASIANYFELCV